ncbi:sulfurtransferase [Inhella gelatinilytica]|uniref:Sulfurtransferase n=1 Tax=Inhella gelatinilytica TaxID=2795030 RepID=A0A931IV32_9BURK|nr:sulfurtransferase [Inhella gelatinilytica]MBH9552699.1 sulfurtransferase [Inhella gelatinilytica]
MNDLTPVLIEASALRETLRGPHPPLVLDCRFELSNPASGRESFAQGHIPGAFYLHLDEDLSGPKDVDGHFRGRHPLPTREDFAARLAGLGWQPGRPVVAYDAQGGMYAARLWWMLRWLGETQIQLLNGGWGAWLAAGGDSARETAMPQAAPVPLSLPPEGMRTTTADQVQAQLGAVLLVDARGPERYRGEVEPLDAQPGHIPGAVNRPFGLNLQADGRFKPAAQLRAEWVQHGAVNGATVHQCGSGVTACHNLFSQALAGLGEGVLYPGSWSEWCRDPRRPVAMG